MRWQAWSVEERDDSGRQVHFLISGEASEVSRAPVVLNLALDCSGSMKGAPLAAAVEAAQQLVEMSKPDDYLGLVMFDGVAEQRVPVISMDTRGKQQMLDALASVTTGKGTALHHAVEIALKGVQRILVPGRKARILLLTDGEPSVGPEEQAEFQRLGQQVAAKGVSLHALGLARHYVAEILQALTQPSQNGFEHVDGPEGLSEAMSAVMTHLFGVSASDVAVRVTPQGMASLRCRHSYASAIENESLLVTLGDLTRGVVRRVLFSGQPNAEQGHSAMVNASAREQGEVRAQVISVEEKTRESAQGALVLGVHHELELVAAESAAWLSLARRDIERSEVQLETAERHAQRLIELAAEGLPARRHLDRLNDLRIAVERGEGDIPLLVRRAQAVRAGTDVSQVIAAGQFRPVR